MVGTCDSKWWGAPPIPELFSSYPMEIISFPSFMAWFKWPLAFVKCFLTPSQNWWIILLRFSRHLLQGRERMGPKLYSDVTMWQTTCGWEILPCLILTTTLSAFLSPSAGKRTQGQRGMRTCWRSHRYWVGEPAFMSLSPMKSLCFSLYNTLFASLFHFLYSIVRFFTSDLLSQVLLGWGWVVQLCGVAKRKSAKNELASACWAWSIQVRLRKTSKHSRAIDQICLQDVSL